MATATYRIDFADIKRIVPMEKVIDFLGIAALRKRSATQWKGACPFCSGLDCFVVSNDGGRDKTGAFNCFKCSAGGDQIELVSLTRGHPRRDAQGALAAAKELHAKFLSEATRAPSADSLDRSQQPQKEKRQGFDPEAYARTLDPAHEALNELGLSPETLREWKAGFAPSGVNRGRLALPVCAADGTVAGYVGRAIKPDASPLLLFPNGLEPQGFIFGADRVAAGHLYLVRDPIAVLKASEAGYDSVVCFLTEEIAGIQLESLAALMDERKCESLSFF